MRLLKRYGARLPGGLQGGLRAGRRRSRTSAGSRRWTATGAVAVHALRAAGGGAGDVRFKVYREGGPVALSTALPILQRMGVDVVDENVYDVRRADGTVTFVHDFGFRLRLPTTVPEQDVDARAVRGRRSSRCGAVTPSPTASTRWSPAAGMDWRAGRGAARVRQVPAPGGLDVQQRVRRAVRGREPGHRRAAGRAVRDAPRPGARRRPRGATATSSSTQIARGARRGREPRPGPHPALVPRADHCDAAHQLVPARRRRRAATRTPRSSSTRARSRTCPKPLPAVRDLGLLAAGRGRAPAVRRGRARRACAGRTAARTSAPRCSGWSRRRRSRTRSSCRPARRAASSSRTRRPTRPTARPCWPRASRATACSSSALLDVTDNLVDGAVVPPADVVRHDGDDPYLVVAADKGTATFSDIANEISRRARLLARRRVRLRRVGGLRPQGDGHHRARRVGVGASATSASSASTRRRRTSPSSASATCPATCSATACCSREHIRLVAAFDHRHVFLDPTPDAAVSFAERRRLFELPRSSWADYDASLISAGGGVFTRGRRSRSRSRPRCARRSACADDVAALTPAELIRAILRAPVDLLWNGGIGTYVKATTRDPRRRRRQGERRGARRRAPSCAAGSSARAATSASPSWAGSRQRARGVRHQHRRDRQLGRASTPPTTRSTSRSCSTRRVRDGRADREASATALLAEMTDEVAALVLADNYDQNVMLGNARAQAGAMLPVHQRMIRALEAARRARPRARVPARRPARSTRCGAAGRRADARRSSPCSSAYVKLRAHRGPARDRRCRTSRGPARCCASTSRRRSSSGSTTGSTRTRCTARSSPPTSSTTSSTGPAPRSCSARSRRPAPTPTTPCAPTRSSASVFGLASLWERINALDDRGPDRRRSTRCGWSRAGVLDRGARWMLSRRVGSHRRRRRDRPTSPRVARRCCPQVPVDAARRRARAARRRARADVHRRRCAAEDVADEVAALLDGSRCSTSSRSPRRPAPRRATSRGSTTCSPTATTSTRS